MKTFVSIYVVAATFCNYLRKCCVLGNRRRLLVLLIKLTSFHGWVLLPQCSTLSQKYYESRHKIKTVTTLTEATIYFCFFSPYIWPRSQTYTLGRVNFSEFVITVCGSCKPKLTFFKLKKKKIVLRKSLIIFHPPTK